LQNAFAESHVTPLDQKTVVTIRIEVLKRFKPRLLWR